MDLNRRKFCLRRRFESKFYAKHTVFAWKILAQILLQSKNIRCLLTFIKGHDIIHFVDAKSTTYAGVAELADAIDLGSIGTTVQVQVLSPAPSKGNEKDIAQETPDFIGGFAVSTVKIFTSDFADVKKVFFPFCSEPNSRTTEYKPPSAWIRTNPCAR